MAGLKDLVRERRVRCSLRDRRSLYVAAGTTGARELLAEHELRQRAGLPGTYLDYRTLRQTFGVDREAAILSPGAADADPLCLAQGLMASAVARGASLYEGDAVLGSATITSTAKSTAIFFAWSVESAGPL